METRDHRQKRKRSGAFYTPPAIAQRVIELTFASLPSDTRSLHILDPAVGEGAFFEAILNWKEARAFSGKLSLKGFDIDPDALRHANAFDSAEAMQADFLHQPPREEFDFLVGNPPWVSFSGRHSQKLPEGFGGAGWKSLHSAFVLQAIRWLKPGGRLGFVLPLSFCYQARYASARQSLLAQGTPLHIEPLGERAFPAVCEPSAILVWEKASSNPEQTQETRREVSFASFAMHLLPDSENLSFDLSRLHEKVSRNAVHAEFVDIGAHTGNASSLLLSPSPKPQGNWTLCREGKDLFAYQAQPPSLYLRADFTPFERFYARPGLVERQKSCPILLRQTSARPVAALNELPFAFRNSVLGCFPPPGYDARAAIALLNSPLYAFFMQRLSLDACQRAFPQLKVSALKQLPFKSIRFQSKESERRQRLAEGLSLVQRWIEQEIGLADAEKEKGGNLPGKNFDH